MFEIFHIIDNMGVGGAQSMMFELYHAINKHYPQYPQQVFYTRSNRSDSKFMSSYNVPCILAKNDDWILKKVKKNKRAVVIYHKLASSGYKLLDLIKSKSNAKIMVINHTFYKSSSWKNTKSVDVMVAVSNHMLENLQRWYPHFKKVHIYNSVSSHRYDSIKPRNSNKKGILLTGRVNRICGWKHSNAWNEWCKNMKLPVKMTHEYIGGGIGGRGRYEKGKMERGRNIVHMMGSVSDFDKKVSIIKDWDLFLYETIKDEGISMAILESLACGVPVICSDHFGNKEIIEDGVNGYVFKDKHHAQTILTRLIKHPKELAKLKETTKRHFVEKLDSRHMAYQYIKLMEEIMGNKSDDIKKPEQNLEIIEQFKQEVKLKEEAEAKKNSEKFTIITSGYNKGKYLNEWADSIIRQKYRPLEVVFANDKSTDGTLEVIKEIEKRFEENGIEFKLVDNPKQLYCGGSYHNLTNHITGFYAGVLDADDMLAEGAVDHVMDLYKKNPDIYWVYTQFLWCNEKMQKGRMGLNSPPPKGQSLLDLGDRGVHGIGSGWRTFSHKIKRPDKLFGRHLTCAVDKNMGYRLEEAGPGLYTEKKCYIHRGHPIGSTDSVSSTKNAMNMWKQVIKEAHSRRKKYNKKAHPITR